MQPELPKASKPLIIIVDDDTSLLRLLRSIPGASGFRVLMANNGDHALRICSRFHRPIDAIITDVEMPGISGFTLAAEVSARRPLMPVLFMSGSVAEGDWKGDRTMPAACAFMGKPFTAAVLHSKLKALIAPARLV